MCISDFYWAAPEVSYMEAEEQRSVFVQMQLPNNDFAKHKDIFHCCCPSYNENALSKGSGSTLTILQQVMKVPANQYDYFPRVTLLDHLILATTMYEDCPERFDFL